MACHVAPQVGERASERMVGHAVLAGAGEGVAAMPVHAAGRVDKLIDKLMGSRALRRIVGPKVSGGN